MAKKFNLGDYIEQTESKLDMMPRLVAVELHLIDPSPGNFYSMPGLEALADNIATVGLLEPLRVREKDGRYVVVSGHRRRAALRILMERGEMDPHDKIPVFLDDEPDPGDAQDKDAARIALRQLRLIYANSDNRQYSSADKTREVQELTTIFSELKRLGYQFPGKLREHVAAAAHISDSRAARLAVIGKNLTAPKLREAYEAGRLGENAAYEIARRSPAVIGRVDELPMGMVCEMTLERLDAVLEGLEKKAAEDAAEVKAYNDGVKAMQPETPVRPTFDADEYIRERTAEDLRYLDMTGALLDQLIHAIPGVIHNRREGIDALKHALRWSSLGGAIVNYEGRGNGLELYRLRSSERLLRSWTEAYDALCTAAINRLGKNNAWDGEYPGNENDGPSRAPAPTEATEPRWMTGEPEADGWYCCWATWEPETGKWDPDREFLYRRGAAWFDSEGYADKCVPAQYEVHKWFRIPDDPEEV